MHGLKKRFMASDFFKLRDHLRNYYIGMKWVRSCSCREDSGSGVGGIHLANLMEGLLHVRLRCSCASQELAVAADIDIYK